MFGPILGQEQKKKRAKGAGARQGTLDRAQQAWRARARCGSARKIDLGGSGAQGRPRGNAAGLKGKTGWGLGRAAGPGMGRRKAPSRRRKETYRRVGGPNRTGGLARRSTFEAGRTSGLGGLKSFLGLGQGTPWRHQEAPRGGKKTSNGRLGPPPPPPNPGGSQDSNVLCTDPPEPYSWVRP